MQGAVEGFDGRWDQMTYSGDALAIVLGDDMLNDAGEEGAETVVMRGEWGGDGDERG